MSRGEFPAVVRRLIVVRSRGCCEGCGRQVVDPETFEPLFPHSFQHRRARGMGGSRNPVTRSAANGLLLCGSGVTYCHGHAESHPVVAKSLGWAVSHYDDPRTVRVKVFGLGWVLLTDDGYEQQREAS